MIYRALFVRPVALVPGLVRYKARRKFKQGERLENMPMYSYQWEHDIRVTYKCTVSPAWNPLMGYVNLAWPSQPTADQLVCLNHRVSENSVNTHILLSTYSTTLNASVTHEAYYRGDEHGFEVIKRALIFMPRLFGAALLCTCR
jgi:hypothetical protein